MKAQDYVEIYNEELQSSGDVGEAVYKVLMELLKESVSMIKQRKISTNEGLFAVIDECDKKWRAVCRDVECMNPEGFMMFLEMRDPELYASMRAYKDMIARKRNSMYLTPFSTRN
jgi:hypothetical protein